MTAEMAMMRMDDPTKFPICTNFVCWICFKNNENRDDETSFDVDGSGADVAAVGLKESLGAGYLHYSVGTGGSMHGNKSCAYSLRSLSCKDCCSHHAVAAGHEVERAVVIFINERVERLEHISHVFLLDEIEVGWG